MVVHAQPVRSRVALDIDIGAAGAWLRPRHSRPHHRLAEIAAGGTAERQQPAGRIAAMALAGDLPARHEREERLDRLGSGGIAVVADLSRVGRRYAQEAIALAVDVDLVAVDDGHGLRRRG